MNNKKVFWIIFAVALVAILVFSGIFKATGTTSTTLNVKATNTTVVVKDSLNNVISNDGGLLVVGDTYTIELVNNETYILKVLRVNETSQLTNLVDNKCTFVCTGNTTITAISIINPEIENPPVVDEVTFYSLTYNTAYYAMPYGEIKKDQTVSDIIIQIKDIDGIVLCDLAVGETYDYLIKGEKYTLSAYSTQNEYKSVTFTTNSSNYFTSVDFPQSFTAKHDLKVKILLYPIAFPQFSSIPCIA